MAISEAERTQAQQINELREAGIIVINKPVAIIRTNEGLVEMDIAQAYRKYVQ